MATKTTASSILQSLVTGGICHPDDLKAFHIILVQQANTQSCDDDPSEVHGESFEKIKALKDNTRKPPGAQNLVARRSTDILSGYCGLNYQMTYGRSINMLALPVGNDIFNLPNLQSNRSHANEYTLGQSRISTVYLPQYRSEDGVVHAREMFCLLAMARKSYKTRPDDKSYPVGVVTLWNYSELRILMATIPASFLKNLTAPDALSDDVGFKVQLSPYFDTTESQCWKMVKAFLQGGAG